MAADGEIRGSIPERVISFMKEYLHEIDEGDTEDEWEDDDDDDNDDEEEEKEEEVVLTKEEQSYIPPCR